ncbi:MAG: alpha-E domain-containing protein [Thiolinea sp.]
MQYKSQRVSGPRVLEFLIADTKFLRALHYSLQNIANYLSNQPECGLVLSLCKRILEQLAAQDIQAIPVDQIHVVMDELQAELSGLHADIASTWFHPEMDLSQMQQQ